MMSHICGNQNITRDRSTLFYRSDIKWWLTCWSQGRHTVINLLNYWCIRLIVLIPTWACSYTSCHTWRHVKYFELDRTLFSWPWRNSTNFIWCDLEYQSQSFYIFECQRSSIFSVSIPEITDNCYFQRSFLINIVMPAITIISDQFEWWCLELHS